MSTSQKLFKVDVAAGYLARFPDAASKTLARKAYTENGAVWPNLEACRKTFQYLRGTSGEKNRKSLSINDFVRPTHVSGDAFGRIPKPIVSGWHTVNFRGPMNALVLNDIHVPYHNARFIETAIKEGKEKAIDFLLLNGDIIDCYSISRWETDPRKRKFKQELDKTVELLRFLRSNFPKARMVYKLGNHEERYESYMMCKAPELLDIPRFELESMLEFENLGIECVREKMPIKLGKLHVIHGHEYRFAISNPVNPARGTYLRGKVNALCGHFHRSSSHSEKAMDEKVVTCWSVGCGCDMHPDYMPLNSWNLGFARVEIDAAGAFCVNNLRVVDGKVYE
jgi:predicted phosphodiesterase